MQHILLGTSASTGFGSLKGRGPLPNFTDAEEWHCGFKVGKPPGSKQRICSKSCYWWWMINYISNDIKHHQWTHWAPTANKILSKKKINNNNSPLWIHEMEWNGNQCTHWAALPIKCLLTFNNLQKSNRYDEPIQNFHIYTFKASGVNLQNLNLCICVCLPKSVIND